MNPLKKFFYKKKYPYHAMMIQASRGMVLVTDTEKLVKLIVYIVKKYIGVHSASVFLRKGNDYVLMCRRGKNKYLEGTVLESNSPVVTWLEDKKSVLLRRYLKDLNTMLGLKEELERLNCEVCVPSFWRGRMLGFLILAKKMSGRRFTRDEADLLTSLSNNVAVAIENAQNFAELEKIREREKENYFQTVLALAQTVDEKDSCTRGHLDDVCYYGMRVAEELLALPDFDESISKEDLRTALRLHDIGKIGVPDAILNKPGKLDTEEWEIMKQHCEIGARILEPIERLKNVATIVKYHQEKFDGTGYPDGLKGEDIPLESRIISVVDAFHAMVSDRPYRKALSIKEALAELGSNAGSQFDPVIVAAFIRAWEKGKIKKYNIRTLEF